MDPQRESDRASQSDASRHEDPWWLQPGVKTCETCLRSVQYEALYHCHTCDRPLCITCSVTVVERRIVLCADCAQEEET
jgi:hypothetical protein